MNLAAPDTPMRPETRTYAFAGGALALVLVFGGFWFMRESSPPWERDPSSWSAQDSLEAYIHAQLEGDFEGTTEFIIRDQRETFEQATDDFDRDDLIAAGLNLEQDAYSIVEALEDRVTFFSRISGLYLVMIREEGRWRVDPARTDFMNGEGPDPADTVHPSPDPS